MSIRTLLASFYFLICGSLALSNSENSRFVGQGELADVVIEAVNDTSVKLFLSLHKTNEPLQKAQVSFQSSQEKQEPVSFKETAEAGIYGAEISPANLVTGQILVQTDSDTDAIEMKVADYSLQNGLKGPAATQSNFSAKSFLFGALATLLIVTLAFFGKRFLTARKLSLLLIFLAPYPTQCVKQAYAHGGHDHGGGEEGQEQKMTGNEIIMPKSSQFLIGLRTAEIFAEKTSAILKSFGHIVPRPQNDAMIIAPQPGFLKGTQGLTLGKKIKQGDTLGYIQTVTQIRLSSPIDGEISEIHAVDGTRVESGSKVLRITNADTLWIDAELFANQVARLSEATSAYVMLDNSATGIEAKIIGAMTPISEETRTAKVFLELVSPPKNLKIGTFVSAVFALTKNADQESILLPKSALLNRAGEQIVFVQTAPEKFSLRQIFAEDSSKPGFVVVTKGLKVGERVVTEGNYQLMMRVK